MSPDLSQPTHWFEKKDTLGGILFLRLKAGHLRPKDRVLNGRHYALLTEQTLLFRATRTHKHKFEVPEVLSVTEYLKGDPMMWRDDRNNNVWTRALIPHNGSLFEEVELWNGERSVILLMRDTGNMDPSSGKNNWYFFFYANPEEEFLVLLY
jgi:hypothetical protein